MSNLNKKCLLINRGLSDAVFGEFKCDLKILYGIIRSKNEKGNRINVDGDFWDMQLRENDTITLYYKSCAFNFKLKVSNNLSTYKLYVSDALKTHMRKFMNQNFFEEEYNKPLNIESISLSYFFSKYRSKLEESVNDSSYNSGQKERKRQQYITALLEKDSNCFVIDYEVVVENVPEELSKITFNKECKIKKDETDKTFKELDLLVLKKNSNNKYEFIPIELKTDVNPGFREAICQVNAYTRILKHNIDDFITCYQRVAEQKGILGIIDCKSIEPQIYGIERNISKSLAIVLYDDIISNRSQKEKSLKEILQNCESACGFENQRVEAIAVSLERDNDAVNSEKLKAIFMSEV